MRPQARFCLLAVLAAVHPAAAGDLDDRLSPLLKAHKGRAAVAVKHLTTGEECTINADEPMPTASLIKLPILVETYWQASEGKVTLTDPVTLRGEDKVPGSGILTLHFSDGATFPLRDAARLMIAYSDNTATNLVLDKIGIPSTNARMAKLGFPNTRINAKVFKGSTTSIDPARTKEFGLGSTTAREMVQVLELIESGKVATPEACKQMLGHLLACDAKDTFPRLLPAGTKVAHKTGAVNEVRTDAGILYLKSGPVAICGLTAKNEDQRWTKDNAGEVLLARVAKEVYDHFTPAAPTPPPAEPKP